ncbi:MAG: hypothetical protein M1817_005237 [Caeruleum heppii]|nr:MAG: hypothetical protein M1817_005237 [Caeruleum heppii]
MSNLATKKDPERVRDNQRRSRARRRQYLQELEDRWRACESAGAQASTEIQSAARQVAWENKQLKALLRETGVDDGQIEAYLKRPTVENHTVSDPVDLEGLLTARRPCIQSHTLPSDRTGEEAGQYPRPERLLAQAPVTPPTSASSCASTTNMATPVQICAGPCQPPVAANNMITDTALQSDPLQSTLYTDALPPAEAQSMTMSLESTAMSCQAAAEIIASMGNELDQHDVQRQLGCQVGTDCAVDNGMLFTVMDRCLGQPDG